LNTAGRATYDCDTPEDLLDGRRERPARIMGLCCSETNELGSTKRECCRDEDVAEAFESMVESSWIIPIFTSNIA